MHYKSCSLIILQIDSIKTHDLKGDTHKKNDCATIEKEYIYIYIYMRNMRNLRA